MSARRTADGLLLWPPSSQPHCMCAVVVRWSSWTFLSTVSCLVLVTQQEGSLVGVPALAFT